MLVNSIGKLLLTGILVLASAAFLQGQFLCAQEAKPETAAKKKLGKLSEKQLIEMTKGALDKGCNFLIDRQREDGAYGDYIGDVGITALVLHALAQSPRAYTETDGPFISKSVDYLMTHRKANGAFYNEGQGLWNYKTSMTILALNKLDSKREKPLYTEQIMAARQFLLKLQCSEQSAPAYDKEKNSGAYGGIGYGSDRRPDLSNTQFALEALKAAGLAEDSDAYQRAIVFIQRCQNVKENDHKNEEGEIPAGSDGGFGYRPGSSKGGTAKEADGKESPRSTGSMTYAGLKSYIYAGLKKDDPKVQAAISWIRDNYTLTENPGMATELSAERGQQGLYYYYLMMARTFEALEIGSIQIGPKKVYWAEELARCLLEKQDMKGFWVNPADKWMEGDRCVVTGYSLIALRICYDQLLKAQEEKKKASQ